MCLDLKIEAQTFARVFIPQLTRQLAFTIPPSIKLLNFFQGQKTTQGRELMQLLFGAVPKKRKAKYVRVDKAITRVTEQTFGRMIPNIAGILLYLDAVAHQLWDVKHWNCKYMSKSLPEMSSSFTITLIFVYLHNCRSSLYFVLFHINDNGNYQIKLYSFRNFKSLHCICSNFILAWATQGLK